jgi:DNA polymerase III subunit epsilon
MYAVVDLETTGLRPSWHDRVVEVAVVHVDGQGNREREWCSLVNPERDMGPQAIHGITAAEARRAPTFAQLAYTIVDLLKGRVVVAHNWRFDAQFPRYEYDRLGFSVPISFDRGLCTMTLADKFLPTAGRSLLDCCHVAGIEHDYAHFALHDARAPACSSPATWMWLERRCPGRI